MQPAQDLDANALFDQIRCLAPDGRLEQTEEALDLLVATCPVLTREGVDRQRLDAAVGSVFDDRPDGIDACGVTLDLGQAVHLGPAAIAVHDDRHVARQRLRRRVGQRVRGWLVALIYISGSLYLD